MSDYVFPEQPSHKEKMRAIEIANEVASVIENDKTKVGSLLCEGLSTSIDAALYSVAYPEFVVVPANGCTDIIKLLPRVRKFSEYPAFAIIDRDNRSKKRIKQLTTQGVYVTKLPFIENIICCPEVLKVISREYHLNYQEIMQKVKSALTRVLAEKLSYLNPFNVELPWDGGIQQVKITIISKDNVVKKNIDLNNVMYTFRDKMIVSEVADAIKRGNKEWYYNFIASEIKGEHGEELISIMTKYLPKIRITED